MLDEETGWFYRNDGKIVKFYNQGATLLSVLLANKGKTVTHECLIQEIWHEKYSDKAEGRLTGLIGEVNKKIKGTARIRSKRGTGYMIF